MRNQINNYPSLTNSYKSFYPFRIGTTSFIYPDFYVPNVRMLGPYVDEIELLLFESGPVASLLSKTVIADLQHLSHDFDLTYNIHLPTDIAISDPNPDRRESSVFKLLKVLERVERLCPTTCTLHVPFAADGFVEDHVRKWRDNVYGSLAKILKAGIVPAEGIAIETLNYSFEIIEPVIEDLNLSICMDIGHLIIHDGDIQAFFGKFAGAVAIIHLHGVKNGKDHLPLDRLPATLLKSVFNILKKFSGTVSLEVFDFEYLQTSLDFLEIYWHNGPGRD
jgi:sugar phosphate isomerase/epimerase